VNSNLGSATVHSNMSADFLNVAVLQLTSIDDVAKNVATIIGLLASLEADVPDLICLPENSLYFRVKEGEAIPSLAFDDGRLEPLRAWARKFKTTLHLGSIPRAVGEKLFNSSVLILPDGSLSDVYQKIHLFDVDVAGHKSVRESDVFAHGPAPAIIEVAGWKIGCTICYDLRFAELFSQYAKAGVDLLLIPSAFIVPTGKAHWEILTRARAIESQAYVVAAAQGGIHTDGLGNSRGTYGHSIIVDPWGEVVETLPDDFGSKRVLRARLSKERIAKVRAQIPMSSHRRL
jgi:predicted amidohydrolase